MLAYLLLELWIIRRQLAITSGTPRLLYIVHASTHCITRWVAVWYVSAAAGYIADIMAGLVGLWCTFCNERIYDSWMTDD